MFGCSMGSGVEWVWENEVRKIGGSGSGGGLGKGSRWGRSEPMREEESVVPRTGARLFGGRGCKGGQQEVRADGWGSDGKARGCTGV